MALKGQKPDDRLLPYRWATILQFQYRFKDNFGFASVVRVSIETTRRCWNLTTTWLSRCPLFSWNYFQKREFGWDPLQEKEFKFIIGKAPFVSITSPTKCSPSNSSKIPVSTQTISPRLLSNSGVTKSASIWRCDELKVWWWAIYCLSVGNLVLNSAESLWDVCRVLEGLVATPSKESMT